MTTNRLEAFSDGIIAIIITIMVFDLKLNTPIRPDAFWQSVMPLLPKFISYAFSFLTVAIMWINHHQLFQLVRYTNGVMLWLNIHLLFWICLIPFSTNLIGENPFLVEANVVYGFIFLMNALAFLMLRQYSQQDFLLAKPLSVQKKRRILFKNMIGVLFYFLTIPCAYLSVYWSFLFFIIVPIMYFIPEKTHQNA